LIQPALWATEMAKVNDAWTVVKDSLTKIEAAMANLSTEEKDELETLVTEWMALHPL